MPRAAVVPSAPQPGAGSPAAADHEKRSPAAGRLSDAIAELRIDLESHRRRAVEVEALIAGLVAYAANGTAPAQSAPPSAPPPDGRKHRPSIEDDERRRRQAASMRRYRASKAVAKPKPKPPKRRQRKAAAEDPPPGVIADAPAVVIAPPPPDDPPAPPADTADEKRLAKNLRRKIQRATRLGHEITTTEQVLGFKFNQSPTTTTPWTADPETGVLSRERITAGTTPVLRDIPLPLNLKNGKTENLNS